MLCPWPSHARLCTQCARAQSAMWENSKSQQPWQKDASASIRQVSSCSGQEILEPIGKPYRRCVEGEAYLLIPD